MSRTVLFDASRLISRIERTAPTGVDRVCLAYAEWLMALDHVSVAPVQTRAGRLAAVDPDWFRDCIARLRSRWSGAEAKRTLTADQERLIQALSGSERPSESVIGTPPVDRPRSTKPPVRLLRRVFSARWTPPVPSAELYINVGHTGLCDPAILRGLQDRGVDRVVLLHDLIPITHPEFCRPGDGEKHRARVLTTLRHASRILVNSHYTASELHAFAARESVAAPPVDVVHLGLEPTFLGATAMADPRPYFVHIGTIEARKNLAFLLTVWRRLEERMGPAAPRLVLIGRYGWENEAVLDHLERSPALKGLVHQASDLPDSALVALLRSARALVAPSSVEGYDLPAVEASSLGVPVIASDIPAHRELVPDARLVDPLDGLGWLQALEDATRFPPKAEAYVPPTWEEHFARVADRLQLDQARPKGA